MSWFSVPLPNPFKALQFSDDENEDETQPDPESQHPPNDAVSPSTGLKDDLSAIGETLGRQFRGVASFLSPPPPPAAAGESSAGDGGGLKLAGIRSDLAEIGGSFKTSLSLLSTTKAVSEISNLASNFFRLSDENEVGNHDDDDDDDGDDNDDEDEGPGITDEVVEFASKISNRSELWIDFPLSLDQEFDMSDAQSEHAAIIEQLVPSLADLRSTLSSDISEKQFWMIYFILLLPRLNEDDLELLSTPEIVEARETLLLMLRSKNDTEITSENPEFDGSSNVDSKVKDREMEKSRSVEKAPISENLMASQSTEQVVADNSNARMVKEEHENTDNWLEQEEPITSGPSYNAPKRFQSEEDVSFSDLEDDDDDRPSQSRRASSPEESNEWIRLNQSRGQSSSRERESEGEESSDWLKVDDFDP